MSRVFGMVASSIWRSRKFRSLSTNDARLAYLYLHTCPHGNSVGAFILPPELANLELRSTPETVRQSFGELVKAGLARYDDEEELIQIVNFYEFNPFGSRKHYAGSYRVFHALPECHLKNLIACDMALALCRQAMKWEANVEARAVFFHDAGALIKARKLEELICSPEIGAPDDILIGVSIEVLIPLPIQQRQKQETETETYTETGYRDIHRDIHGDIHGNGAAQFLEGGAVRGQTDPLADGSRSGRKPSPETAEIIADLSAKSKIKTPRGRN